MSLKRVALLIGCVVVTARVFPLILPSLTSLTRPPTEEERVRAVFTKMLVAVLEEDFEDEWECFSSSARAVWAEQLGGWKKLDPEGALWAELCRVHGLERPDVLRMNVREFFVACRSGRVRLDPRWRVLQQDALRSLPRGRVEFKDDGTAWLSFDIDTDPEIDIESLVAEFEKEDGDWRLRQMNQVEMSFRTAE